MTLGGVLWAVAVIAGIAGGDDNATFYIIVFPVGVVLMFVGGWMARPSRRSVMVDRIVDAPAVDQDWLEQSSDVSLISTDSYDIRMFEVSIGDAAVVIGGNRIVMGGGEEWKVLATKSKASVSDSSGTIATATKGSLGSGHWVINDGSRDLWLEATEETATDKSKSEKHLWGKDMISTTRRSGVVSFSEGGNPAVVINVEYRVASQLTRRFDANRAGQGSFRGSLNVKQAVPVVVALLALRLVLGSWAKKPPQTGEWTTAPAM